jgi:signal transduction histidine kinase
MEQELLEISHREQMRIGQDLHDGLGQHLTGITFLLRALEKKLAARQLPEAAEVAEVLRLVMQALAQTRSLARGLVPVELESKGLRAALQELAATAEHVFRIRCTAAVDEAVQIHDQAVATHLFRLAQEALNNAVRHGKAKHVTLELTQAGEYLALTIQDDGVGLPKTGPPKPGLGLKIMQYRAQKLGGVLQVQPGPHGGTVVSCIFPCPPQPAPSQTEPAADAQLLLAAGAQPAPAHAQPSPEGSGLSHLQPI